MAISIGIIGSGLSGLACAWRILQKLPASQHRCSVSVFEWGRGPGGRMARKRVKLPDGQELFFDHGAPFFSLSNEVLRETGWKEAGYIAEWDANTATYAKDGTIITNKINTPLHVGIPESNNALCKSLAEAVAATSNGGNRSTANHQSRLLYARHVRSASWNAELKAWEVVAENRFPKDGDSAQESYTFDILVLSDKLAFLPNQYAVLQSDDAIAQRLMEELHLHPQDSLDDSACPSTARAGSTCDVTTVSSLTLPEMGQALEHLSSSALVLLVALQRDATHASGIGMRPERFDVGFFSGSDTLGLVVSENRKPGRIVVTAEVGGQDVEQLVVHSTTEYAANRIEWDPRTGEGRLAVDERMVAEEMWNALLASGYLSTQHPAALVSTSSNILHRSVFVWDHARPAIVAKSMTLSNAMTSTVDAADGSNARSVRFWWSGDGTDHNQLNATGVLGVCGDFFGAGDVNAAALSGLRLADRVLEHVSAAEEKARF